MRITKKIVNLITVVFAAFIIFSWSATHLGYDFYEILSGSMEPTIQKGDVVMLNTTDKEVKEEHVAAFWIGDAVVVHRVKAVTADGIITKGDANDSVDPGMRQVSDVIGLACANLGVFSGLYLFLSGYGKLPVLLLIVLANIGIDLWERRGKKCKESPA